jgi:hypothetical protein
MPYYLSTDSYINLKETFPSKCKPKLEGVYEHTTEENIRIYGGG